MKSNNRTVFIIDDEIEVCNALRCLFESVNFKVKTYKDAQIFLKEYPTIKQGCIIIDVRMPTISGLELLEKLHFLKNRIPVIIMTGHGDIPMAIRAMKSGAVDFVLKPFNDQCLLEIVQKHLNKPIDTDPIDYINERINSLSYRERQVIDLILDGKLNKEIAYELSISISTVEAHRANIMRKMQAKNLAHLIKLFLKSEWRETSSF